MLGPIGKLVSRLDAKLTCDALALGLTFHLLEAG